MAGPLTPPLLMALLLRKEPFFRLPKGNKRHLFDVVNYVTLALLYKRNHRLMYN